MGQFYEAVTGGLPTDDGLTFPELLARLAALSGSGAAAARRLGVADTTFYRWRRGVQRPKTGENVVRAAVRRTALAPGREQEIRTGARRLVIVGLGVQVSNDRRPRRVLRVGDHIPVRTMSRILNTWLSGDDDKTDRALWRAIDKYYTGGMDIEQVESVDFR